MIKNIMMISIVLLLGFIMWLVLIIDKCAGAL